jgi:hypothetical protein
MYPQNSVNVTSMTISPGDTISASVQYLTTGSHAGQFELSITDTSQANDSFTIYESGSGLQRSSAEWVVEAPSSTSGILPLANFGSVAFTNASATINGVTGPIDDSAWQSTAINMVSGATTEASTSGLTDSNGTSSFSVGYQSSGSVGSSWTSWTSQSQRRSTWQQASPASLTPPFAYGTSSGVSPSISRRSADLAVRDQVFASLPSFRF